MADQEQQEERVFPLGHDPRVPNLNRIVANNHSLSHVPATLSADALAAQRIFRRAVEESHVTSLQELLHKNNHLVDVNQPGRYGRTALMEACWNGDLAVVQFLVEFCSREDQAVGDDETSTSSALNWNMGDGCGCAALLFAAYENHVGLVEFILQQPTVDVNRVTLRGNSALHVSCRRGHVATVRKLLQDDRVDVNIANHEEETPLHKAAAWNHVEIVELLLQRTNVDLGVKGKHGNTALHLASAAGHGRIVQLLLEHQGKNSSGSIRTVTNAAGQTPYEVAASYLIQNVFHHVHSSQLSRCLKVHLTVSRQCCHQHDSTMAIQGVSVVLDWLHERRQQLQLPRHVIRR